MEWLAWGLVILILWTVAAFIALALISVSGMRRHICTCLGDYDDDNGRTCARCHE